MSGRLSIALLLLGFAVSAFAASKPFEDAAKAGEELDARFCWSNAHANLIVDAKGAVSGRGTADHRTPSTRLPATKNELVERVWVLPHAGDFLVAYETFDGEGGWGGVCRLGGKALTKQWCSRIPAFNVMAAISDSGALYVAAYKFTGRIDPSSGKYIWRQRVYKGESFNIFSVPEEDGAVVTFGATSGIPGAESRSVTLDRGTGEMVSAKATRTLGPPLEQKLKSSDCS